jgi:hypothetical protein
MDPAMGLAGSVTLETITMARTMYIRLNLTAMAQKTGSTPGWVMSGTDSSFFRCLALNILYIFGRISKGRE